MQISLITLAHKGYVLVELFNLRHFPKRDMQILLLCPNQGMKANRITSVSVPIVSKENGYLDTAAKKSQTILGN